MTVFCPCTLFALREGGYRSHSFPAAPLFVSIRHQLAPDSPHPHPPLPCNRHLPAPHCLQDQGTSWVPCLQGFNRRCIRCFPEHLLSLTIRPFSVDSLCCSTHFAQPVPFVERGPPSPTWWAQPRRPGSITSLLHQASPFSGRICP